MMFTTLFTNGFTQLLELPSAFRMPGTAVRIRRQGKGIYIEPVGLETWPEGFFEAIRVDDANFDRPEQGTTPEVVGWEALG